ncbi:hypothetical protein BDZ94DRAFT_1091 [Collybia nuda]|uniref:EthD domain-containing protein n=1 Tax=Collybia nuda TaxID=64659 RepID=A0A9P6CQY8_9AGAR|nr:hypothetical protein BDZ94DRAFT_1091 [Collybia nuda]
MSLRQDRVRILAFIKKVDSVSKEEFSRYWVEDHSKIFMSMAIAKTNLLKYEQAHTNDAICKVFEGMGMHPPPWDGMATFEAESYEKIFAVFKDEEYLKIVLPDELKFIDRPNCKMLPLDLAPILDRETTE